MVPSTLCAELAMAAEGKRRARDTVYTCTMYVVITNRVEPALKCTAQELHDEWL